MNRPLTDVNSLLLERNRKGEISHRYILGLYDLLWRITCAYPDVLFEGCSSGGARFDPGMLYFFPQNWTSDNTDAYDRIQIQSGFSLLYPPVVMGAHVSITPNHQTGRNTPLETRYQVARLFNLGYELDLSKCKEDELTEIKKQVAEHKKERQWIQYAVFFRHEVPNDNYAMWSMVSRNKDMCVVMIIQKLYNPLCSHGCFKVTSLNPDFDYMDTKDGKLYGGDELMQIGLTLPLIKEDFHVFIYELIKADG